MAQTPKKGAVEKTAEPKQEVAVVEDAKQVQIVGTGSLVQAMPDDLALELMDDAGKGISQRAEDNLIPFISILQALSPQLKRSDPKFMEEAVESDILLGGVNQIANGEGGIIVQPVDQFRAFVEWKPNRMGFVAQHADMPPDTVEKYDQRTDKRYWERTASGPSNGNLIVDTRYFYVICAGRPFVIAFSSAGHQEAKQWSFSMNGFKLPNGNIAPSFAHKYHLTTTERKNKKGDTWFGWKFEWLGYAKKDERDEARLLYEAIHKGEKIIDTPPSDTVTEDEDRAY
jgi:hypothetical protein